MRSHENAAAVRKLNAVWNCDWDWNWVTLG